MPIAFASRATSRPMPPRPTTPIVLPASMRRSYPEASIPPATAWSTATRRSFAKWSAAAITISAMGVVST